MWRTDMPPARLALVNSFSNAVGFFIFKNSRIYNMKSKIVMPAPHSEWPTQWYTESSYFLHADSKSRRFSMGLELGLEGAPVASPVSKR